MGWMNLFLFGDAGQQFDINASERRIRDIKHFQRQRHRRLAAHNRSQDEQIAALEAEVEELQTTLGVVTTLLMSRGLLAADELALALEEAEPDEGSTET